MSTIATNGCAIRDVTHANGVLHAGWSDGFESNFHSIWLRDNCRCDECGIPETGRRALKLTEIPLDIEITEARIEDADELAVQWSDGHRGKFEGAWLREYAYDPDARKNRAFAPQPWTDQIRDNPPRIAFEDANTNESSFLQVLHHVRDSGLCFLHDAPTVAGTLEAFARKIGPVQESNFGLVQDLVVDPSKRSVGNSTIALKPHTDEPYRASPPGILLFHCIETDATGAGSSTFMDGFEIAEQVRREDPEGFAALTRNRQGFRRHFEGDVDLIAEFPVVSVDEFGNLSGVRINDRVAAPAALPDADVAAYYRGMRRLLELAEDPDLMIKLTLRPGDVAIFDNHRVLHGRTALTIKGRRWLQWMQVERGDFHSIMRIVADRLSQQRDASPLLRGAYG